MRVLSRRIAIQRPGRETPLARRRRHCRLVREFARELLESPSIAERVALARCATLQMAIDGAERLLIAGEAIDPGVLVKMTGEQRRTLAELRKHARPPDTGPTLAQIIAGYGDETGMSLATVKWPPIRM
jgi:hypothetical protein